MAARYQHILIATDFSEPAQTAVRYGGAMARQFGARVTLLHAYDAAVYARTLAPITRGELDDAMAAAAREDLERIASAELADVEGVDCATQGSPSAPHAIVEHARRHAVDLCVVGTHGRSGIARLMAGSVAEKVVRHAPCDVITVPMTSLPWPPRRILVGTDMSSASLPALDAAQALGDAIGAEVTAAYVLDETLPATLPSPGTFETLDAARERTKKSLDEHVREHLRRDAKTEVLTGASAARELCLSADRHESGLIVVGTHGRTGIAHLLIGSEAERSVRHAHTALMVVRSASVA